MGYYSPQPFMSSIQIEKYGLSFPAGWDGVQIEQYMIRNGGRWRAPNGRTVGEGLFYHYRALETVLWPEDDHHRWSDLALKSAVENKICVFMGPGDSNKTYSAAKFCLADYWTFPNDTMSMISSTDGRGLELRVWGKIKDLFNRARERFPYLPGQVIESLKAIATDDIEEDDKARVLNRGIIGIPCLSGGKYVGLGKYVGIKQKRVRLFADECQLMGISFLDAVSNLMGNPDFKALFMGNPIDTMDPLGKAAEPEEGWDTFAEPTHTTTWKTRFKNGVCVNFVGTDSPNFDYPQDQPVKYDYLISRRKLAEVEAFWGKDSLQWYSQCVGVMKSGLTAHRVITKELCRQHKAFGDVVWKGEQRLVIAALDAAYSGTGGDRCVLGHGEFGIDIDGVEMLKIFPPVVVPINMKMIVTKIAEDQIADYVKKYLSKNNVSITNLFYDSTGRGTLGSSFARIFGTMTPVPVEFGGSASRRPVRHDLYVMEKGGQKRLKRCDEHYSKFVTELWFSVRYLIECEQLRGLPEDVCAEGCMREYGLVAGNRIEVEKKEDTKERMGRSPDLFDWLATLVEGARQRGLKIKRLGIEFNQDNPDQQWLLDMHRRQQELMKSKSLNYQ